MGVLLEIDPVTLLLVPPALVLLAAISLAQFGMVFRAFSSFAKARHGMLGAVQPGATRVRHATTHARCFERACRRLGTWRRVWRNAADRHGRPASRSSPKRGVALGINAWKRGQVPTWAHARASDGNLVGRGAFHEESESLDGERHRQTGLKRARDASSHHVHGSTPSLDVSTHARAPCRRDVLLPLHVPIDHHAPNPRQVACFNVLLPFLSLSLRTRPFQTFGSDPTLFRTEPESKGMQTSRRSTCSHTRWDV